MFDLPNKWKLIDSPGIRDFTTYAESFSEIISGYKEIKLRGVDCKFHNSRANVKARYIWPMPTCLFPIIRKTRRFFTNWSSAKLTALKKYSGISHIQRINPTLYLGCWLKTHPVLVIQRLSIQCLKNMPFDQVKILKEEITVRIQSKAPILSQVI